MTIEYSSTTQFNNFFDKDGKIIKCKCGGVSFSKIVFFANYKSVYDSLGMANSVACINCNEIYEIKENR
jgi:hypothetical protein